MMEETRAAPRPACTLLGLAVADRGESTPDVGVGAAGGAGRSAAPDVVRDQQVAGIRSLCFPDCVGEVVKAASMPELWFTLQSLVSGKG